MRVPLQVKRVHHGACLLLWSFSFIREPSSPLTPWTLLLQVLMNMGMLLVVGFGKILQAIFFGSLRAIEVEVLLILILMLILMAMVIYMSMYMCIAVE